MRDTAQPAAVEATAAQGYRPDIDGLRAVAVLSVFAFHLYPDACPGGFVGVDVFFVISGYLISRIIMTEVDGRSFSILSFYERRVRRIAPALVALLIGVSVIAAVLLPPAAYVSFGASAGAAGAMVSNFFFSGHTRYFDISPNSQLLLHTWSLAVEEQFYLVFPWLFLLGRRARLSWWAILLPLFGLSLVVSVAQTRVDPSGAFYSPVTRAWEFLMGALLIGAPPLGRRAAEAVALAGLALLVVSLASFVQRSAVPGWRALAPCAGAAALIWSGRQALAAGLLRTAPAVFVGRISYSLYLWHWPLIVAARYFWGGGFSAPEAVLIAILAFGLAYASWRFIEQPPRRDRRVFTRGRLFAGAGAAVAVFVAQAFALHQLHGLPGRYSERAQAFLQDAPFAAPPGCGPVTDDCVVGDRSKAPTSAVIGDSIAVHLLPGVAYAAAARGQSTLYLAQSGCLPLVGVNPGPCPAFLRAAAKRIAADPGIDTVLLVGRWPSLVEPRYVGRDATRHGVMTEAAAIEAFRRTRVAFGGRPLLLLVNVPEQPVDVPAAAADRANLGLPPFMGVRRDVFDRSVARTNALMARVAPPDAVLDASRLICGPAVCAPTLNGRSLYADDLHPSTLGAVHLAQQGLFDPLFAR